MRVIRRSAKRTFVRFGIHIQIKAVSAIEAPVQHARPAHADTAA